MVFSSIIFLFLFLPVFLFTYFALSAPAFKFPTAKRLIRNTILLLFSIVFYAWGEKLLVLVMLTSTVIDYVCGLIISGGWRPNGPIEKLDPEQKRKPYQRAGLILSIVTNLSILGFFKYSNFFLANINESLQALGLGPDALGTLEVVLPLGISFYTFQSMSYTIDVYRGEVAATRNFIDFTSYVTMFPQLVAGPIIRYRDISLQLVNRVITREGFAEGIRRFVIGLGKKTLIADVVALPADRIFAIPTSDLTPGLAWLAVICYTLQIYFDFSGYSDMAIGLGHMLGFTFLENFRFPYIAVSIQDFWRRWHISLSTWFRDYLYIPLGGNRVSKLRNYTNLVIVFFLCGLWHGASWTFVVWGLYHGAFLVVERLGLSRVLDKTWRPVRHVYVVLVAMVGWVIFRADTFGQATAFLKAMVGISTGDGLMYNAGFYLDGLVVFAIVLGIIGSTPIAGTIRSIVEKQLKARPVAALDVSYQIVSMLVILGILMVAVAHISSGTYSPFIYFRF